MVNRILLADDSITIQKVVNLTFADEGIEVVSVSNGDMAERRLSEVNPDLVLADIFMPGKNGYELCEAIKESPQFRNVPVVLLVGAFEPFDQAEARRVRADAHMTKPFESRTLVETVRKLINSSAQPRMDAQSSTSDAGERAEQAPLQPLKPDLSALTDQAAPPATAESDQESHPPLEVQFHTEQYQIDDSSTPLSWTEQAEVEAAPKEESLHQTDPLDFAPFEVPAPTDSKYPSAFGEEPQGMVLDLDSPEAALPDSSNRAVGFDLSADSVSDVSMAGIRSESSSDWSRSESDSFKTQMLEPPHASSESWEPVDTNPLEMPGPSDFNRPSVAPVGFAEMEAEDSSSSTLLAVDEPLGDVLMDDSSANAFSYESHHAAQAFFTDQAGEAAKEELNLEFIPQDQEVLDVPAPSRVTGELSAPASFNFDESPDFSGTVEPEAEQPPVAANELVNEPVEAQVEAQAGLASFTAPAESEAELTEFGFELKSDSHPATAEKEPVDFDYAVEASDEKAAQVAEPEAEFTSSSMWTEQETRFAPIDIEASPVNESEPERGMAESYKPETGFELAAPIEAAPSPSADTEAAQESPGVEQNRAEAAAEPVEASPALVDEIVRRVVSQMTESVVREIAWEVVPDVVERVIKEMARQEVSKRE